MRVDTKTMLEENHARLDGKNGAGVGNPTVFTIIAHLSAPLIHRANIVFMHDPERPNFDYFLSRKEVASFLDAYIFDKVDTD